MGKEDSKFYYSLFISIAALFIVLISTLSNMEKFPEDFIAISILAMLILLMVFFYTDNFYSKRRTDKLIHRSVRFNEILNFLQSLKILPYQVDLLPLINVIKRNYHVVTWVKLLNESKYISDIWYDEIFDCLTNINNEIIEKDNLKLREKFTEFIKKGYKAIAPSFLKTKHRALPSPIFSYKE